MFPITKAPTSWTEMLLGPLLLKFTEVPKSFPELLRSIAFNPADTVVVPRTVMGPDCEEIPLLRFNAPLTVPAPRMTEFRPVILTLFPLVITTVPKLFAALLRVMLLAAPPTKVIVPGTTNAPL